MVTSETALMLAHLHRERDATAKLIAECVAKKDEYPKGWEATFEDRRDRPNLNCGRYMEIRIPSGSDNAYMPRMVSPALGLSILRAHAAEVSARIVSVNEMIRAELDTDGQIATHDGVEG